MNIDRTNEMNAVPKQEGSKEFMPNCCDIVFNNVGFEYNNGDTVLEDVSFTAKQGEVTALVGPSGGGKTTVSRLAARFWDADKGTITVGGVDISVIDPETLLSIYSIVFQEVTLFNNSILENIRIGKKDAPIILLDEATASLDTENETLIQTALSRLIKDKTVLIIAHRMRTVATADKIVVIKNGKAEEQGTPKDLYAQSGVFANMVNLKTQSN